MYIPLTLTETSVSTNATSGSKLTSSGTRVHGDWLLDDQSIGNELADGSSGVGIADLADLLS